jgi:hypothetical protein
MFGLQVAAAAPSMNPQPAVRAMSVKDSRDMTYASVCGDSPGEEREAAADSDTRSLHE